MVAKEVVDVEGVLEVQEEEEEEDEEELVTACDWSWLGLDFSAGREGVGGDGGGGAGGDRFLSRLSSGVDDTRTLKVIPPSSSSSSSSLPRSAAPFSRTQTPPCSCSSSS